MLDLIKIVLTLFICVLVLVFALPLLWLVIQEIGLLFGWMFDGCGGYVTIIILCVIAWIVLSNL